MSKKANFQECQNGEDSNGLEQKSESGAIKFTNDDSVGVLILLLLLGITCSGIS